MASALWSHQFCLACDRQVESDGDAYCSESCRLTELERTSTASSQASSPGLAPPDLSWSPSTTPASTATNQFSQTPNFNLTHALSYMSSPRDATIYIRDGLATDRIINQNSKVTPPARVLTPSSSHSSLCSIKSNASGATNETSQLSEKSRKELLAYQISFDQVRSQRRRSY